MLWVAGLVGWWVGWMADLLVCGLFGMSVTVILIEEIETVILGLQ